MPEAIYYVLLFIICSAFFSGIEIAFISSNKLQIELLHKQGKASGKRLVKFFQQPSSFITTTMIGNTLSIVLYDFYMTELIDPYFRGMEISILDNELLFVVFHSLTATLIALVFAEFLPKSVFFSHPNALLSFFSLPISIIYKLLWPLTQMVIVPTKWFMSKVAKINFSEEKPVFGYTDLDRFIRQHTATPKDDIENADIDTKILENALEFSHLKVHDCMRPRTEIVAIDYEEGILALKELFKESGHSKIVVYKNTIDDIVGYVHIMAMFSKPSSIEQILTPILIVPEVASASQLLLKFIEERKSLAIAVDEFGGTAGLVSMEDIIEEIFGEIDDEHDEMEAPMVRKIEDNKYLVNARTEIDYLNETLNLNIPHGDYETVGGYIISELEDLPKEHQVIDLAPFFFTIKKKVGNRIEEIEMKIDPEYAKETHS